MLLWVMLVTAMVFHLMLHYANHLQEVEQLNVGEDQIINAKKARKKSVTLSWDS